MVTPVVAQSVLGLKSLVGISGAQSYPPTTRGLSKQRDVKGASDLAVSSCAIRALSGRHCSSSHRGLSQPSSAAIVGPVVKSVGSWRRVGGGSIVRSSAGGEEFGSSSFLSTPDGSVQFPFDNTGRKSGSAINSFPEDQNIIESESSIESEPSLEENIARPQPIVQGFADSPFLGEFALDLTAGSGSSEFESMTVSAMPMYRPKLIWFAKSPEQENMFIDRAINATIVGSAGILALTKILTVDHDYWHGWTVMEILRYAPVHNWFAYEELLKSHPVLAKMMISGTVYAIGDWIAQCYEGKPVLEFNRARMLRSGLVGFCLHGSMSHFYYHFSEWLFPFQGWWVVPLKVGFDQTLWAALWNSLYFVVIGLLRFESPVEIWKELRATFVPLLTAGWKLWPLAHLVTYGVVPVEQRLLWVDMVEILWVTILAMYSNEKSEARIAEAETTEETKEAAIEGAANAIAMGEVAENGRSS